MVNPIEKLKESDGENISRTQKDQMPIDTTKPNFLHQSNCNKKKKAKFFFWKNRKKIKNSEIALLEQCGKQHK